jgi:peptidoglycan/LPS O-acetylase OafA/YrhL
MLFIDNFNDLKTQPECTEWGWYMAVDLQLFLILPWILFAYKKNSKLAYGILASLLTFCFTYSYWLSYTHYYRTMDMAPADPDYFQNYYYKPYCRMAPILIGLLYGILYRYIKDTRVEDLESKPLAFKISDALEKYPLLRGVFYIVGFNIIMSVCCYLPKGLQDNGWEYWTKGEHATYIAFAKAYYVIGIAILVAPIIFGKSKGLVFQLLGNKGMVFLGKLTFGVYLFHIPVFKYMGGSMPYTPALSHGKAVLNTLACGVIAFLISFIVNVVVEQGGINFESKFIFKKKARSHGKKDEIPLKDKTNNA